MTGCELVSSCPYFLGTAEMPESYREEYCGSEYQRCGRYMVWIALERERNSRFNLEISEGEAVQGELGNVP
ncbi:MAG: hypothetical protein HYU85_08375 [Chloroflexi bacterium]|nr:hypothetical protein [Chloroflexota bacterium]MBI3040576.1 hypothetical protein [Chloroflexota bacterium]